MFPSIASFPCVLVPPVLRFQILAAADPSWISSQSALTVLGTLDEFVCMQPLAINACGDLIITFFFKK